MRLRRFQAATTAEAMRLVRAELGEDALLLSTRRAGRGVEVTAALEPASDSLSPPPGREPEPALRDALAFHRAPDDVAAALCGADDVQGALAARIAFAALPLARGTVPLLFAGPPGAGKTLTVARLATRLVLAGTAPLVVTADGQRAGAAEQLAAFTRLLGLTLLVANHPVTLGRALARRADGAPVLIDAPGGDPACPTHADEIAGLVDAAGAKTVAVIPAGLDAQEAADLAAAHAAAGARHLVATRLDAARRLGGVLAAATADRRLALCELGIGPGAADGLVPASAALLAGRLLAPPRPIPAGALP